MPTITWENYLWPENHVATNEQVNFVETSLNIKFPAEYLRIAIPNQGKVPRPSSIDVRKGTTGVSCLMFFDGDKLDDTHRAYGILWNHKNLSEDQHALLIPFADALGSSVFAFDYRKSNTNPPVVFVWSDKEGEEAIIPVAASFSEFLSKLYESESISV